MRIRNIIGWTVLSILALGIVFFPLVVLYFVSLELQEAHGVISDLRYENAMMENTIEDIAVAGEPNFILMVLNNAKPLSEVQAVAENTEMSVTMDGEEYIFPLLTSCAGDGATTMCNVYYIPRELLADIMTNH